MDSHELAKMLLKIPNKVIAASVDISVDDKTACDRVFGYDLIEAINGSGNEVTLCFETGIEERGSQCK